MQNPAPIVVASRLRPAQLLAGVERDLARHGRAMVVSERHGRRHLRKLGHTLRERGRRVSVGGFDDGQAWLRAAVEDDHAWLSLYFERGLPGWWSRRAAPEATVKPSSTDPDELREWLAQRTSRRRRQ